MRTRVRDDDHLDPSVLRPGAVSGRCRCIEGERHGPGDRGGDPDLPGAASLPASTADEGEAVRVVVVGAAAAGVVGAALATGASTTPTTPEQGRTSATAATSAALRAAGGWHRDETSRRQWAGPPVWPRRPTDDDTRPGPPDAEPVACTHAVGARFLRPYVQCRFTRSAESGAEDPAAGGPARLVAARPVGPVQTIDSLNPADLPTSSPPSTWPPRRPRRRRAAANEAQRAWADVPPRPRTHHRRRAAGRGQQGDARRAGHRGDRQAVRRGPRGGAGGHRHLRLLPRRGPPALRPDRAEREPAKQLFTYRRRSGTAMIVRRPTSRRRCRRGTWCRRCSAATRWCGSRPRTAPAVAQALDRAVPCRRRARRPCCRRWWRTARPPSTGWVPRCAGPGEQGRVHRLDRGRAADR